MPKPLSMPSILEDEQGVHVQLSRKGNNCSGGHKVQLTSSSAVPLSPRVPWHQQGPEGNYPGTQDTHKFTCSHPVERCSTRTLPLTTSPEPQLSLP